MNKNWLTKCKLLQYLITNSYRLKNSKIVSFLRRIFQVPLQHHFFRMNRFQLFFEVVNFSLFFMQFFGKIIHLVSFQGYLIWNIKYFIDIIIELQLFVQKSNWNFREKNKGLPFKRPFRRFIKKIYPVTPIGTCFIHVLLRLNGNAV